MKPNEMQLNMNWTWPPYMSFLTRRQSKYFLLSFSLAPFLSCSSFFPFPLSKAWTKPYTNHDEIQATSLRIESKHDANMQYVSNYFKGMKGSARDSSRRLFARPRGDLKLAVQTTRRSGQKGLGCWLARWTDTEWTPRHPNAIPSHEGPSGMARHL